MVKDLRTAAGPGGRLAYPPAEYVVIGNVAFFFADDGINGVELWRNDGTDAGTFMVRDIHPGSEGSLPTSLTVFNRTLFFAADDGTNGIELWKSDGTADGTMMVKDIRPGPDSAWPGGLTAVRGFRVYPAASAVPFIPPIVPPVAAFAKAAEKNRLLVGKARLFFRADDGIHGSELWVTDGTEAGTTMVSDILPGLQGSGPQRLTDFKGKLFFAAYDPATGVELWKSNGTAAGTQLVADILPGPESSTVSQFTPAGDQLFFTANDGMTGMELWKTDGTAGGTVLVKDINTGPEHSGTTITAPSNPRWLTYVDGILFFSADDGDFIIHENGILVPVHGRELWKTDGTEAGTVLVKDISFNEDSHSSDPIRGSNPALLTNINGTLFFIADQIIHPRPIPPDHTGLQLWKSDGTEAGTVRLTDFSETEQFRTIRELTKVGDSLFFSAGANSSHTFSFDVELWKSDGTPAGTVLVADIRPGDMAGSNPRSLTNLNGTLLFEATTTGKNRQLWRSDGTLSGTTLVKDIQPLPGSSLPAFLADANGTLFFTADEGSSGVELWRTDGTEIGTELVTDIHPGLFGSTPRFLTFLSRAHVVTKGGSFSSDLGQPPSILSKPDFLPYKIPVDTLFFSANDGITGEELWQARGATGQAVLVKDLFPGIQDFQGSTVNGSAQSSSPEFLTVFNGLLFFKAFLGATKGHQLWKSDGTAAGTMMVANPWPTFTTSPFELTSAVGSLFMAGDDGVHGEELWISDGTAAGTVMLTDLRVGADGSNPQHLTEAGEMLFFVADDGGGNGRELWRSDGTVGGTVLVKDIRPGPITSNPRHLAAVGGMLFFTANEGASGDELWISNGTAAGTRLVKDILQGPAGSMPSFIADGGPTIGAVFAAYDTEHGMELWHSDGTPDGTLLLADIVPGARSSNPRFMTLSGSRLFFTANDNVSGWELWSLLIDNVDGDVLKP